jgi:hypothetical protein
MAVSSHRVVVGYLIIGIIGTAVLVFTVPFIRVRIVEKELNRANVLLADGRYLDAFARLGRIRHWSLLYPPLSRRRSSCLIRCHVKLGDRNAAETVAEEILNGLDTVVRAPAGICEMFQQWPNSLISGQLAGNGFEVNNEWAGYEILVSELVRADDKDSLRALGEKLLKKSPSARLQNVLEYHLGVRADDSRQGAVDAVVSRDGGRSGGVEVDHCRRARDHISRNEWNSALKECRLGLVKDPGNGELLRLRQKAVARGACWGVVKHDQTKIYNKAGKYIGTCAAGSLVEIPDRTKSGKGGRLCCNIVSGVRSPKPVYIDADALDVVEGLISQAGDGEKNLRVRRAVLASEISKIERDIARDASRKNPHADEYAAAKKKYDEFWAKVKNLQTKRDGAVGAARMRYVEQLRELKGQDVVLGREMTEIENKHKAWELHRADVVDGGDIQLQRAELASINDRLKALEAGQ